MKKTGYTHIVRAKIKIKQVGVIVFCIVVLLGVKNVTDDDKDDKKGFLFAYVKFARRLH